METVLFINGVYHSQYSVSDLQTFLESFCLNNGLLLSEVKAYLPLTVEQKAQLDAALDEDSSLFMKDGKYMVTEKEGGFDVVKFEISLTLA